MLYYLKFKVLDNYRSECLTLFGTMTSDDDKKDAGPVKILGRWSTLGEAAGFCICEASSNKELNNWLLNWINMATIQVVPVVDDNVARSIILGSEPSYTVDYSCVGDEAKHGESLFVIEYTFDGECRETGYNLFANMTEEQDSLDSGKNTCLGRWHNLGMGSGIVICSSPSEAELHKWAWNWMKICDCVICPVVSDEDFRSNIQAKPDSLKKNLGQSVKRSWFR